MGEKTNIPWCDSTWNAMIGCQKVSPGCADCYAARSQFVRKIRAQGVELWGPQATSVRYRTAEANWRKMITWSQQGWVECKNCGWRGEFRKVANANCPNCHHAGKWWATHQRVFVESLGDPFEDHPAWKAVRKDMFELFRETPNITKLLLTKRPENILPMMGEMGLRPEDFPEIWWGTSVENQEMADKRIPEICKLPGIVWLSVEPMLETINLKLYEGTDTTGIPGTWKQGRWTPGSPRGRVIAWVVCGGESGARRRPFEVEWARDLYSQCEDWGIKFFMKQLGGPANNHREFMEDFPEDLRIREYPA